MQLRGGVPVCGRVSYFCLEGEAAQARVRRQEGRHRFGREGPVRRADVVEPPAGRRARQVLRHDVLQRVGAPRRALPAVAPPRTLGAARPPTG